MLNRASMDDHQEVVENHHRFKPQTIGEEVWDFGHLNAFALKVTLELTAGTETELDVIVLFSNHCFTRGLLQDEIVPDELLWDDGREVRVLDRQRYELSKRYLPQLILDLPSRRVQVADPKRPNFVTLELPPGEARTAPKRYAVFFEAERDTRRRKRILLRVQSAYVIESPSKRLVKAEKINFRVLLKRAYAK